MPGKRISYSQEEIGQLNDLNMLLREMTNALPKDAAVPSHFAASIISKTQMADKLLSMGVLIDE